MKIMLDKGAKMPTRAHPWDAGLDLYAPEGEGVYTISPCGGSVTIDTGVHAQIPEGYVGFIKSKSGLNVKHGLTTTGVIDAHSGGNGPGQQWFRQHRTVRLWRSTAEKRVPGLSGSLPGC